MRSILALSLLSLSTLSACDDQELATNPPDSTDSSASAKASYIGGFSQEEVDAMVADYNLDAVEFPAAIRAPFDCDAFGDLCDVVGPEQGESLVLDMLDQMADGEPLSEIQAAVKDASAEAQLDWQAEQAELPVEVDRGAKTADKIYTNSYGFSCYMRTEAKIVNWFVNVEHQSNVTNLCASSTGVWTYSIVGTVKACMSSKRTSGAATSTDSGCSYAYNWYSASKSIWMSAAGNHTATATGRVYGTSVPSSSTVEKSVTAYSYL